MNANLHVIFEWCNAGWTSREEATADAIITGAKKAKVVGSATPWTELFEVKVNSDSWIYTLQVRKKFFVKSFLDTHLFWLTKCFWVSLFSCKSHFLMFVFLAFYKNHFICQSYNFEMLCIM